MKYKTIASTAKVAEATATLKVYRSCNDTVKVAIQNCSPEVATLLWRFDVWNSNGSFVWDDAHPEQRAVIWFECPIEFIQFVESSMGRTAFERMGVQSIWIQP